MLDLQGRVVSWNEGATHIKGYTTDEIIGQHFSRFYLPEDIARGKPEQALRMAAEQGVVEDEGWRLRKDGSRFWRASSSPRCTTSAGGCTASPR
jgi:PAS domain S-box-containing protein